MALCKYLEDNYEIFLERTENVDFCQNAETGSETAETSKNNNFN